MFDRTAFELFMINDFILFLATNQKALVYSRVSLDDKDGEKTWIWYVIFAAFFVGFYRITLKFITMQSISSDKHTT